MKRILFCCFLLFSYSGISQSLEEQLYTATETFIANQNATSLIELEKTETTLKSKISSRDEQLALVYLLCNKAYYIKDRIPNKAINSYEEAWNIYSKHQLSKLSDYDIIEYCLKPLGNLYTKAGNFTSSENIINQYILLAQEQNNRTQQVSGAINLAMLYHTLNKHHSVIDLVDKTLQTASVKDGQLQKLEQIKQQSLLKLGRDVSDENRNSKSLYNKHELAYKKHLKNGNYIDALKYFDLKNLQLNKEALTTREITRQLVEEAQLYFLLKNTEKTEELLQTSLKRLLPYIKDLQLLDKNLLYSENTFIDIFELLALVQSTPEKALHYYDLSFYVSSLLTQQITSQESKLLNITNNRIRSEKCISICYEAFNKTQDSTFITKSINYAEQHKATVLKEKVQQLSLLERFPNDTLLIEEQQLYLTQEKLTNQYLSNSLSAGEYNDINSQLNNIHYELKQLSTQIAVKFPERISKTISLKGLQEKLHNEKATLVEYFYGTNALYQFIVDSNKLKFNKIDLTENARSNLSTFIHLFDNASIINNNIPSFTKQAVTTFQLLQLSSLKECNNIVIIPDGVLNFLPFESLLTNETESSSFSKMPFLVFEKNIAYNSSILFYLQEHKLKPYNSILGVFPVFKNTAQPLKYSEEEASFIKKEMTSEFFMHDKATKENFIKNASRHSVLHLSTHASGGSINESANITFYDDSMTINELYSHHLNPNLVVLSACETGVGALRKGEGAMSIARGFQYAGTKKLVFSLWNINDMSTSKIMKSFYSNYKTSLSGAISNRASKLNYLKNESTSNAKKSPYYWSAFVYYGDFSQGNLSKNYIIYVLFFGILISIVVLLIRKVNSNEKTSKGTP